MHNVVSRIALSLAGTALLAAGLVAVGTGPAGADTATQRRPSDAADPTPGSFTSLTPTRLLDTRITGGPLTATATRSLKVTNVGGVPSDVAAVAVNLTAVTPQVGGYLTAFPGPARPTVSNLNFAAKQIIANYAVVPVADNGTIQLFNGSAGRTDVLVDVTGWFAPVVGAAPSSDGGFTATGPVRLVDTRTTTPTPTPIPAGGTRKVVVRGSAVPSSAGAAVLNITAVGAGTAGYLTVYPGGTRPTVSNLNFAAGQTVAGLAATRLASDGSVTLYNSSPKPLQVAVDVSGWFRGTTARTLGNFSILTPSRVYDSRNPKAPLAAQATRTITVAGRGNVPTGGVSAVVLTVTVTNTLGSGYLTVYPGGSRPKASALNFVRGTTVPNLVIVPVTNGAITVFNGSAAPLDVLVDVAGFVRSNTLTGSVSHYLRTLTASQSTSAIGSQTGQLGLTDGQAAQAGATQVVLLQFGAQTNKAGGNGSGTGSADGVRLSATNMRITYPQVVAAVNGYVDGFVQGRGSNDAPLTVVVGTSTAGFAGATYNPQDKAADWWDQVVSPTVDHASGTGVTVVGGTDIEANFDATITQVKAWVTTYLQAAPASTFLVNNGAASGCPTTIGSTAECVKVPIEDTQPVQTQAFTRAQLYAVSGGLVPGRIKVLPQIYSAAQAAQWENVDLAGIAGGGAKLTFAGVLSSYAACSTTSSGCTSVDPNTALALMTAALDARSSTASTVLPAVTDLTIS